VFFHFKIEIWRNLTNKTKIVEFTLEFFFQISLSKNGENSPGKNYLLTILVKLELQGTLRNIFIYKCCVKQSQTLSVEKSFKNEYVNKLLLNDGSFAVGKHS
jgi:hypothetical protein